MMPEMSKTNKQLLSEELWLLYFNDALYHNGIITRDDYLKMIHQISRRNKFIAQKKEIIRPM